MKDLADQLTNATSRTFSALGYDPAYATVKLADRRDLADFQCNGALALAKKVGRKPQEIAAAVAQAWTATDIADRPTVAGPGFLNFHLTAGAMSARAQQIADDPRAGAAASIVLAIVVLDSLLQPQNHIRLDCEDLWRLHYANQLNPVGNYAI
jgi:arginyl-tRNA synthetase